MIFYYYLNNDAFFLIHIFKARKWTMTASQSAARQYSVRCDEWGRRESEGKYNYE